MRLLLVCLLLATAALPAQAQTVDICDRTAQVRDAILERLKADDCAVVDSVGMANIESISLGRVTTLQRQDFSGLAGLQALFLNANQLTALPVGVFDGLTSLQELRLDGNQLATLPAGVFDGLTLLFRLELDSNPLTTLPAGVFNDLMDLKFLDLSDNQLRRLPAGAFDGLNSLQGLYMGGNQLTALPVGVFEGLTRLREMSLNDNRLATLPAGVFDGLHSLEVLILTKNRLTALSPGVFDGFTSLRRLDLHDNRLATLSAGLFDGLTNLNYLLLQRNKLTALPAGVFDELRRLREMNLQHNHLVGLTRNDPLFARLPSRAVVLLGGQTGDSQPEPSTPPVRLAAAVPLMLSTSDSTRQGFVRIVNESDESGSVRVFAFDDGGHAPDPIEIPLGAGQVVHFNSNDLEDGNAGKGIEGGSGGPVQGDWRLDVESALPVRVLAFVRTSDGFLTAMHDVLPRDYDGRLVAHTFNPGGNMNQESRLRLVNTGQNDASVSIEGVDDRGNDAGPVRLTLSTAESRTLSAFDLENGAQGLTGTLGDGTGKWRLFITAEESVVGMSLLASVTGHLTNISTAGVAER